MSTAAARKSKKPLVAFREGAWSIHYGLDKGTVQCPVCMHNVITQFAHDCGHIIPESKGGPTSIENLLPICHTCNVRAGNMDLRDYTKLIYRRKLMIPKSTYKLPKAKVVIPPAAAEFCEKEFVFKERAKTQRSHLVDHITASVKGSRFTIQDIYAYLKTRGIDVEGTISETFVGIRLLSAPKEILCSACGDKKKTSDARATRKESKQFKTFFDDCFEYDEDGWISVTEARDCIRLWKSVNKTTLTQAQLLERLKQHLDLVSTATKIVGIRCLDSDSNSDSEYDSDSDAESEKYSEWV